VFVDTPGMHRPLHRLNVRMVDAALDSLRQVDVVVAVVDASEPPGGGDRYLMDILARSGSRKCWPSTRWTVLPRSAAAAHRPPTHEDVGFADIVPISALTGDNVDRLEQVLLSHLPEGEPIYPDDYLTDQPERFFVAELVREQVLHHTHDELPFSSAVIVDKFDEPDEKGLLRLYCTILVERESQKPIVIGRAGEMIKAIGTAAQKRARAVLRRARLSRSAREGARRLARGRAHSRRIGGRSPAEAAPDIIRCATFARIVMVAPRRSDVVLDSVKRLLRIGATANLLNLLQKQHPADLAQIFGELLDAERRRCSRCWSNASRSWRWRRSVKWAPSRAPSS
jgi:GTPase